MIKAKFLIIVIASYVVIAIKSGYPKFSWQGLFLFCSQQCNIGKVRA